MGNFLESSLFAPQVSKALSQTGGTITSKFTPALQYAPVVNPFYIVFTGILVISES
jgi:hypothetical protein